MHFRFYGSNMGRFMKPDNIMGNLMNPQSWNKYSYVGNNPVNFNDPTGHMGTPTPLGGDTSVRGANLDNGQMPFGGYGLLPEGEGTIGSDSSARLNALFKSVEPAQSGGQVGRPITAMGKDYSFKFNPPAPLRPDPDPGLSWSLTPIEDFFLCGGPKLVGALGKMVVGLLNKQAVVEGVSTEVIFNSAHGARHLVGTGVSAQSAEAAIRQQVVGSLANGASKSNFWGRVVVDGVKLEYRAWTLDTGAVSVGTYYPVGP
jgi:hypothetical protein